MKRINFHKGQLVHLKDDKHSIERLNQAYFPSNRAGIYRIKYIDYVALERDNELTVELSNKCWVPHECIIPIHSPLVKVKDL